MHKSFMLACVGIFTDQFLFKLGVMDTIELYCLISIWTASSSSAVDQPCLDPQSTFCQELGGAAQVFRRSPQLVGGWLILWPWLVSLFPPNETILEDRLFRFFAIAECRVHDANSLHVRSQATFFCSQPKCIGLLMSCQTVDFCWHFCLFRSRVLASWYVEVDMGCGCLLPDLARQSALSFPGIPQWAGSTVGPQCIHGGEAAGLSAVGGLAGQGYWRLGTEGLL